MKLKLVALLLFILLPVAWQWLARHGGSRPNGLVIATPEALQTYQSALQGLRWLAQDRVIDTPQLVDADQKLWLKTAIKPLSKTKEKTRYLGQAQAWQAGKPAITLQAELLEPHLDAPLEIRHIWAAMQPAMQLSVFADAEYTSRCTLYTVTDTLGKTSLVPVLSSQPVSPLSLIKLELSQPTDIAHAAQAFTLQPNTPVSVTVHRRSPNIIWIKGPFWPNTMYRLVFESKTVAFKTSEQSAYANL